MSNTQTHSRTVNSGTPSNKGFPAHPLRYLPNLASLAGLLMLCAVVKPVEAAPVQNLQSATPAAVANELSRLVQIYAAKSNQELAEIFPKRKELPSLDRRVLLREVKMRLARQRGSNNALHIRTERRYGRIVRKADGSMVRIETRVVQVRPADANSGQSAKKTQAPATVTRRRAPPAFGVGFERRFVEPLAPGKPAPK